MLVNFALERLLYRLSISSYSDRFVLKGALLFRLWFDLPQRPTRDIDFLGFGEADPEQIKIIFAQLIEINVEDGLIFSADSITAEPIRKAAGYPGFAFNYKRAWITLGYPSNAILGLVMR